MVGGIVLDNHNVNNSPILKFVAEPEPRCDTGEQAGERGLAHLRRFAPQVFQPRALDQLCACGFDGDPTSAPESLSGIQLRRRFRAAASLRSIRAVNWSWRTCRSSGDCGRPARRSRSISLCTASHSRLQASNSVSAI